MTLALQSLKAGPGGEAMFRRIWQEARQPFYEAARGDDFIGVQTYNRSLIGPDGYLPPKSATMVDMYERDTSPEALSEAAAEACRATGAPVLITENGIVTDRDEVRVWHMRASIINLADAIDRGLPVLGYIHWSLIDNFEWSWGFASPFGLSAINRTTFKRNLKPSLSAYRRLIVGMRAQHRWA